MDSAPVSPGAQAGPPAPARPASASKLISPFDEAKTALCVEAIREFRAALSQALLYTPGTVQFERTCEATFKVLTTALEAVGTFKLSVAKGQALMNGERMETPTGLRGQLEYVEKILLGAGVGGVRFETGLTSTELGPFLQLLARKQLPRVEGVKVNHFLREQGIEHLQVDDLRYVELKGEERIVTGGEQVLSNQAVAQKAVGELVDMTLQSIEKVGDEEARKYLRAEVADQLMEKSAAMLPSLLATASQRLRDAATDEQAALAAIPPRDGQMLLAALDVAKHLGESEGGGNAARQAVRQLIELVTRPYQERAEDILAQVVLTQAGLDLLPQWLMEAHASQQNAAAADRLAGILRQSPCTLLNERMFPLIVDVFDELSVAGMDAEAGQLASHVVGAARSTTKRERMKAVERLSFLLDRSLEQASAPVRIIEDALLESCTHETSDDVLKLLLEHLGKRCQRHHNQGNHKRALEHLEWIASLEESRRMALGEEGASIARETREELAKSEFARSLPEALLTEGEQGAAAARMMQLLGPTVWNAVVTRIRAEPDDEKARALTARLREIGPEAAQLFIIELGREPDGATVLRLLALAPALQDETALWAQVPALLRHAETQVREAALALVMARDGVEAADELQAALELEADPVWRKTWVQALAHLRDPAGETFLLDLLHKATTSASAGGELTATVFEVLSAAGNRGVIEPAAALLMPHGHTIVLRGEAGMAPKTLLLTAIKALAPFYRDMEVAETLERLRKDKDADVARLAVVCLRGIVAQQQQAEAEAARETGGAAPAPRSAAPQESEGMSSTAPHTTRRTARRGFEALEGSAQVEALFRPGAEVGRGAREEPMAAASRASGHQSEPARPAAAPEPAADGPAEPSIEGLKPSLEGLLGDLGLATTLHIVAGKDGMLQVEGSGGEGRVYIKGRRVVGVYYGGGSGLPALATLDVARSARFAYFLKIAPPLADMDVDIERLPEALREFRADRDADQRAGRTT